MRKIGLFFILFLALALSLASCGNRQGTDDSLGGDVSFSESENSTADVSPDESADESAEVSDTESSEPDESVPEVSEGEVSEADVSKEEEFHYDVVYHTEYVPERLGMRDGGDMYSAGDGWHIGACFDYPPQSFYEYFSDRITREARALFRNAYVIDGHSADLYFGFWLEYFKITKDEYIAYLDYAVDMDDPKAVYEFDSRYPLVRYVNGWYSENNMEDPYLVANDAKYVPKHYYAKNRDGEHNSLYYTINEDLINYVGEKKFKEYLKKYENTTNCNILTFIEYFDIDYLEFSKAISGPAPETYVPRFIYGSKREQEAFFGFYDNASVGLLGAFNPFVLPSRELAFDYVDPFHDPRIYGFSQEFMIYFLGYENKIPVERPEKLHEFERLFEGTFQYNYSFFIKYYGITEEEWKEFLNVMYYDNSQSDNSPYIRDCGDIEFDFDLLFREEHFLDSVKTAYPFSSGRRECKYETYYGEIIDERYNQVYYTIDRLLIEHVGKKAFQKFLDKYEGTADCNIIKFLEFNDLSQNDVKYVYRNTSYYGGDAYWGNCMPYNFSILYMDPKSEDFQKYFGYGVLN